MKKKQEIHRGDLNTRVRPCLQSFPANDRAQQQNTSRKNFPTKIMQLICTTTKKIYPYVQTRISIPRPISKQPRQIRKRIFALWCRCWWTPSAGCNRRRSFGRSGQHDSSRRRHRLCPRRVLRSVPCGSSEWHMRGCLRCEHGLLLLRLEERGLLLLLWLGL